MPRRHTVIRRVAITIVAIRGWAYNKYFSSRFWDGNPPRRAASACSRARCSWRRGETRRTTIRGSCVASAKILSFSLSFSWKSLEVVVVSAFPCASCGQKRERDCVRAGPRGNSPLRLAHSHSVDNTHFSAPFTTTSVAIHAETTVEASPLTSHDKEPLLPRKRRCARAPSR